jgi:hypothetical protein
MWQKSKSEVAAVVLALVASGVISSGPAVAQAVSLQEQLAAQYKLVKMGSDTGGYSVIDKGTLLAIQKGGILGVPYGDSQVPATKYEGGTVKGPSGLSLLGRKSVMGRFGKEQTTHLFPSGDKVYPTKIEVNLDKDTVAMGIVACDSCNKTDPPTYNKAQVVFQFPKGTLAKASAGEVEDTIGQLLSISDDTQSDQGGQQTDQGGQQQAGGGNAGGGGGQQAAQPEQQVEPTEVKLGMTTDQVEAALGKPDKKVTLGPKQIYIYKDMKVTFKEGKVSDVQ